MTDADLIAKHATIICNPKTGRHWDESRQQYECRAYVDDESFAVVGTFTKQDMEAEREIWMRFFGADK